MLPSESDSQSESESQRESDSHSESDTDTGRSTSPSTTTTSSLSECEPTKEQQSADGTVLNTHDDQSQPVHILSLMKHNNIQFKTFDQIENKWNESPTRIELTHSIESHRDAIMIAVNDKIVIFHMSGGFISQAQQLAVDSATMENITLPNNIGRDELALFCRLNDTILCFARNDNQQSFYR